MKHYIKELKITKNGNPLKNINELEYIKGEIWANVWHSMDVIRIDPKTGNVTSVVNFIGLHGTPGERVLNGIAYDSKNERIFVTGKNWEDLFEVSVYDPTTHPLTSAAIPETEITSSPKSSSESVGDVNESTAPIISEYQDNGGIILSIIVFTFVLGACFFVVYTVWLKKPKSVVRYKKTKTEEGEIEML